MTSSISEKEFFIRGTYRVLQQMHITIAHYSPIIEDGINNLCPHLPHHASFDQCINVVLFGGMWVFSSNAHYALYPITIVSGLTDRSICFYIHFHPSVQIMILTFFFYLPATVPQDHIPIVIPLAAFIIFYICFSLKMRSIRPLTVVWHNFCQNRLRVNNASLCKRRLRRSQNITKELMMALYLRF